MRWPRPAKEKHYNPFYIGSCSFQTDSDVWELHVARNCAEAVGLDDKLGAEGHHKPRLTYLIFIKNESIAV